MCHKVYLYIMFYSIYKLYTLYTIINSYSLRKILYVKLYSKTPMFIYSFFSLVAATNIYQFYSILCALYQKKNLIYNMILHSIFVCFSNYTERKRFHKTFFSVHEFSSTLRRVVLCVRWIQKKNFRFYFIYFVYFLFIYFWKNKFSDFRI